MRKLDEIELLIREKWGRSVSDICHMDDQNAIACRFYGMVFVSIAIENEDCICLRIPILDKDFVVPRPFRERQIKLDSCSPKHWQEELDEYIKTLIPEGGWTLL